MLELLISIFGILFTIFFVIGIHELAHFIAARALGIKVLRFSIGFGKTLYRWYDKKGTEYVLALIPLGGYVKMLDEHEGEVPAKELHLAFNRQPFYKKFIVVLAGPLTNLLSAIVLYWLIFIIGFTTIAPIIGSVVPNSLAAQSGLKVDQEIIRIDDKPTLNWMTVVLRVLMHIGNRDHLKIEVKNPLTQQLTTHLADASYLHLDELKPEPLLSLGIIPYEPPIPLTIDFIASDSPAAHSPLHIGDKMIAIDKKPIKNWEEILNTIITHPEKILNFTIERKGKKLTVPVTVGYQRNLLFQKQGYLGIAPRIEWPPHHLRKIQYGLLDAIPHAWRETFNITELNLLLFAKMISGKLSLKSLGGPITIFETAGTTLTYGILPFISFLAFLSISLGIINLFPIPGLDGGHLVFQLIELIIRRPLPERLLFFLYRLGFIFILIILIQALVNDVLRMY